MSGKSKTKSNSISRALEEMLGVGTQPYDAPVSGIYSIGIDRIDDFSSHPFQVRDDEDMQALVESISENGVITPALVRKKDDGYYELISGHRRKHACELLGIRTLPCRVLELSHEEAVCLVVDSNLHRTKILPSEKAKAYKMKLDAMNRQGQRSDLTLFPMATKYDAATEIGQELGDSRDTVYRYIRLNYLCSELLDYVDNGRMGLRTAVELSHIGHFAQLFLAGRIAEAETIPSYSQAVRLRRVFEEKGRFDEDSVFEILDEKKPNQKESFKISADRVRELTRRDFTPRQFEDFVTKALDYYTRYLSRQRDER